MYLWLKIKKKCNNEQIINSFTEQKTQKIYTVGFTPSKAGVNNLPGTGLVSENTVQTTRSFFAM